jgi:hypothetical protein
VPKLNPVTLDNDIKVVFCNCTTHKSVAHNASNDENPLAPLGRDVERRPYRL